MKFSFIRTSLFIKLSLAQNYTGAHHYTILNNNHF